MRGHPRFALVTRLTGGALLAIAGALASPGAAAKTMEQKLQAACHVAMERFCPNLTSDETKACMLRNRARAGAACMRLIDASE